MIPYVEGKLWMVPGCLNVNLPWMCLAKKMTQPRALAARARSWHSRPSPAYVHQPDLIPTYTRPTNIAGFRLGSTQLAKVAPDMPWT